MAAIEEDFIFLRVFAVKISPMSAPTPSLEQQQPFKLPTEIGRHYLLGLASTSDRVALQALLSITDSLLSAATEIGDNIVAHAKLSWWSHEIDNLFAQQANHPDILILQKPPIFQRLSRTPFERLLAGVQTMREQTRHLDFASLQRQADSTYGSIAQITAAILGASPLAQQAAHDFGMASAFKHYISDLGYQARKGRIDIPMDELSRFGITVRDLTPAEAQCEYPQQFTALMAHQRERALCYFQNALSNIPAQDRKLLRPMVVNARLQMAWLDLLPGIGYQVLHQYVDLSPLKAWWVAIRAR